MALADIFKKKKASPAKPALPVRPEPSAPRVEAEASPKDRPAAAPGKRGERKFVGVIIAPHLTEKTSRGNAEGWYAFRVSSRANKTVVRKAVEERYGVTVERVRMLHQRSKRVQLGRIEGVTPGFKKALVKLRAGQSIEVQ